MVHRILRSALVVLLTAGALIACDGRSTATASEASDSAEGELRAEASRRDPRILEAARALDRGETVRARSALASLGEPPPGEALPLLARLAFLDGENVVAFRYLAEAAARSPEHDEVYATEAELLVALERRKSAEEKIREGWKQLGAKTAALERARGVLLIATPGQQLEGLQALERARELDPELPFLAQPLVQAYVLAGRQELGADRADVAGTYAKRALALAPELFEARELLAEARFALLDFEGALAIYEELATAAQPYLEMRALCHQRAATALLLTVQDEDLEPRRARALEHYLAARALGMQDDALGHGLTLLADAASAELDRGLAHYEKEELVLARERFERALVLDPPSAEAHHMLATVLFRQSEFVPAADHWRAAIDSAAARGETLPDPLHLNLARAERMAGNLDAARAALARYLDDHPEGSWLTETREMLAVLEQEAAGR